MADEEKQAQAPEAPEVEPSTTEEEEAPTPEGKSEDEAPEDTKLPPNGENEDFVPQDQPTPSELHVTFAGPGSAMIKNMQPIGVLTTNQVAALGIILLSQAITDWQIPVLQQMVKATVVETIHEIQKPKIEAAAGRFFDPSKLKGGGGRPG